MRLNSNPNQPPHKLPSLPGPYLPLSNRQKFESGFLFSLPDHPGVFQILEDRNGRDYVSRCICGKWQYDYTIEIVTVDFVTLTRDGHTTMFLFEELEFAFA